MFIGHVPAGYLITRMFAREAGAHRTGVYAVGMFSAVLPDADLLYFYLIDARQHLHHGYWTHIPLFWLATAAFCFLISMLLSARRTHYILLATLFTNIFAHLLLDTVAGKIRWLYPISSRDFVLFHVDSTHGWWIYNFIFHWTFALELLLLGSAAWVLLRRPKQAIHRMQDSRNVL